MSSLLFVPSVPWAAITLILSLALYKWIIYPVFRHPLGHIPSAHWSVPIFGDTWILYQRWRCRNNAVTYAAHLKHGTVVRMGRNELSVSCVDNGIRTIYGGGWEKHAWYPQQFASYGVINMFSTIHHTPHSQKKRTMANIYSKSYLASSPQVAANSKVLLTKRFLPLLQSFSDSGMPADVHGMNNAFTMDFMSAYQFGLSSSTNFTQNLEQRKVLQAYHCRREFEVYSSELPWVKSWSRKVGLEIVPKFVDEANELLQNWGADMCRAAKTYINRNIDESDRFAGDEPVVYKQFDQGLKKLRSKDESGGKASPNQLILPTIRHEDEVTSEVYSEMLDQLGAGHETSAIALTYLYWELSKHPGLQDELRKEVTTQLLPVLTWPPKDPNNITLPEPKTIDSLPLLQAILMETLRLHSPIPGMEPRISPPPTTPEGNILGPYKNIPSGIRVSSMPYTLHRNPMVFPDPETFNPSRWLSDHTSESHLKEMHRWFWAFGSGGRMCIGSHLAIQEIKLVVAALYTNWTTEIVDDEGIEELDAYTTRPRSNRLMLRFRHV